MAFVCATVTFAPSLQRAKKAAPQAPNTPSPTHVEQTAMVAPSIMPPRPEYQFPLGQTYIYGGEWRIFNAGVATLRMEQAGQEHRIVATADAAGTIALLYHVQAGWKRFLILRPSALTTARGTLRKASAAWRRRSASITSAARQYWTTKISRKRRASTKNTTFLAA